MSQTTPVNLPVVEEMSEAVYEAVAGGQPILLLHHGQPVVLLDYESWEEVEALVSAD